MPDHSGRRRPAKLGKSAYKRNLPHLQPEDRTFFVTFCTWHRWRLPESVRGLVLEHCLRDHGVTLHVHGMVVMPDHVHLVLTPLMDAEGCTYTLAEILNGIKGASAHSVNEFLNRRGRVWQDESFDHVLRSEESAEVRVQYVCENPVRWGLVRRMESYPWLWRDWVEGV